MKLLLSLLIFLSIAITTQAEVVKPFNILDRVKSTVNLSGVLYEYTVSQRGWHSYADSSREVQATNKFIITYESKLEKLDKDQMKIGADLGIDATTKCNELGRMEYLGQIKNFPSDLKTWTVAKVVSYNMGSYSGIWGSFVCDVNIFASPL